MLFLDNGQRKWVDMTAERKKKPRDLDQEASDSMALHGIAWHCMALHGIAWHCMALHGIAWPGEVFKLLPAWG
jgi:hypothetical protein